MVVASIYCVPEFICISTPFTYHVIQLCDTLNIYFYYFLNYVSVSICTYAGACGYQRHGILLEPELQEVSYLS